MKLEPLIEAAKELGRYSVRKLEARAIGNLNVLIDQDGKVISLEKFEDSPRRKRASVTVEELQSFVRYLNAHKEPGRTHIFVGWNTSAANFYAVIDFHGVSNQTPPPPMPEPATTEADAGARPEFVRVDFLREVSSAAPGWGEHWIKFNLTSTPEWAEWLAANRKSISQAEFAEFIEDHLDDISSPDGATLLEVALGLQGRKDVAFRSGKNLRDGSIQFEYSEQVITNGTATRRDDSFAVPSMFTLAIVPFRGAAGIEISARLRFRIDGQGRLSFTYILNRPEQVLLAAVEVARAEIEKETGIPVLAGTAAISPAPL